MSVEELDEIIVRHRRSGVLIDTNLLILLWIGRWNPIEIARHRRTQSYTVDEFERLERFVAQFQRIVTTPCILAEANSLAVQIPEARFERGKQAQMVHNLRQQIASRTSELEERHVPSLEIVQVPEFLRFGLTDVGIQRLAGEGFLVLTDDVPLYALLCERDLPVVNFNHIRFWEN